MSKLTPYYWNANENVFETCGRLIDSAMLKLNPITEDKFEGFLAGAGYISVTEDMAKEFYRDLVGTAKAENVPQIGTVEEVARLMKITEAKANCYLLTCACYKITERQGGFWIYE